MSPEKEKSEPGRKPMTTALTALLSFPVDTQMQLYLTLLKINNINNKTGICGDFATDCTLCSIIKLLIVVTFINLRQSH